MGYGLDINRIARQNPLYAKVDDRLDKLNLTIEEASNIFWFIVGANYDNDTFLRRLNIRLDRLEKERAKQ